jgi:hypothetical protein
VAEAVSDKPPDSCPRCGSEHRDRVGPSCLLLPDAWHKNWHAWVDSSRPQPQRFIRRSGMQAKGARR